MIKILIIIVVVIVILFVLALSKTAKRADKNAKIILERHEEDKKRLDP